MKRWCGILLFLWLIPGCGGGTIGTGVHPPPHSLFRERLLDFPSSSSEADSLDMKSLERPPLREDECNRDGGKARCPR